MRHTAIRRRCGVLVLLATALAAAVPTAPAVAATAAAVSSNWAGYVVRGSALGYRHVYGAWVAPAVRCTPGSASYSAFWVGLGGYQSRSSSLEQIGTEADCGSSGRAQYSVWYEAVPAGAVTVRIRVVPGDTLSASVGVSGHSVLLRMRDVTRGTSFSKRLRMSAPDLSSAEWIAETPVVCDRTCGLPALANFGTVTFANAAATTVGGHTGAIADPGWSATAIALGAGGGPVRGRLGSASAGAQPSALVGSGFAVAWQSGAPSDPNAVPNGG